MNDTRFFYQYNLQGDVIGILAGGHSQVVRYEYDAWGKVISITGSRKDNLGKYNPFRYRHYMYDDSVSLYYLKSRHYHPTLCRFLQADKTEALCKDNTILGCNLYTYAANSPINRVDKNGSFSTKILVYASEAYRAYKKDGLSGLAAWSIETGLTVSAISATKFLFTTAVSLGLSSGVIALFALLVGVPIVGGAVFIGKTISDAINGDSAQTTDKYLKETYQTFVDASCETALGYGLESLSPQWLNLDYIESGINIMLGITEKKDLTFENTSTNTSYKPFTIPNFIGLPTRNNGYAMKCLN